MIAFCYIWKYIEIELKLYWNGIEAVLEICWSIGFCLKAIIWIRIKERKQTEIFKRNWKTEKHGFEWKASISYIYQKLSFVNHLNGYLKLEDKLLWKLGSLLEMSKYFRINHWNFIVLCLSLFNSLLYRFTKQTL